MTTRKTVLTKKQVLGILGISERTLRVLIRKGEIRCGRTPGGHRRFDADEVERARNVLVGMEV